MAGFDIIRLWPSVPLSRFWGVTSVSLMRGILAKAKASSAQMLYRNNWPLGLRIRSTALFAGASPYPSLTNSTKYGHLPCTDSGVSVVTLVQASIRGCHLYNKSFGLLCK